VAVLTVRQLQVAPPHQHTEHVDAQPWDEDGEKKDDANDEQFVPEGQHLQVTKEKQSDKNPYRRIERREQR
jgi:hypothetical protein